MSESKNPTDYLKKMRKRDEQLAFYIGTNCPQVEMKSLSGKNSIFVETSKKNKDGIINIPIDIGKITTNIGE